MQDSRYRIKKGEQLTVNGNRYRGKRYRMLDRNSKGEMRNGKTEIRSQRSEGSKKEIADLGLRIADWKT
jgi:hypothetical protein